MTAVTLTYPGKDARALYMCEVLVQPLYFFINYARTLRTTLTEGAENLGIDGVKRQCPCSRRPSLSSSRAKQHRSRERASTL